MWLQLKNLQRCFFVRQRELYRSVDVMPNPRRGFTLVEMLTVIIIVSIIASLSLLGLQSARTSGKIVKTKATILKLHEVLLSYYDEYETRRVFIPNESSAGRSNLADLRRLALRRVMTLELPEQVRDIQEAFTPSGGVASFGVSRSGYNEQWDEVPPVSRRYRSLLEGVDSATVSSADLLYMIVMRGPVADPDIISHFRPDELGDTSGPSDDLAPNGLKEFVDAWGRPICFRRWPVGFASPLQPIDGLLSSIDERVSADGHRLLPLIYSAGPDREFDLNEDYQFSYRDVAYNPFNVSVVQGLPPGGQPSEVALFAIEWPDIQTSPRIPGPRTYKAVRGDSSGSLLQPSRPLGAVSVSSVGFQTVASERRSSGFGAVRSRDNIHNHDAVR